ncbi:cellulase family glycosylhydrolase [Clostridium acetobutylicum]|uniref:cellulase family glycosylhydrolase n=1 Tax=Clostridium acetobutylicum TaxID=1488 RepID=UPI0023B8C5E3|nr:MULTISPECIES: cellulase family glycosylhydrolase [Clostridium]
MLDESFMNKVDEYIKYTLKDNLIVVLDFHHFEKIMENPEKYKQCFLSVWRQLSKGYENYHNKLMLQVFLKEEL